MAIASSTTADPGVRGRAMKSWLHILVVLAVSVVVVIATAGAPYRTTREIKPPAGEPAEEVLRVRSNLDSVMFPRVELKDVSCREALDWVRKNIPHHAPASVPVERRGMKMACQLRAGAEERVTLAMKFTTLPELLDAICAQHDYMWSAEQGALSIVPRERVGQR